MEANNNNLSQSDAWLGKKRWISPPGIVLGNWYTITYQQNSNEQNIVCVSFVKTIRTEFGKGILSFYEKK